MTTADKGSRIKLSMSGGGVRLSAYVGALAAFREAPGGRPAHAADPRRARDDPSGGMASGGASRTVMLRLMSREPKDLAHRAGKPAGAGVLCQDTILIQADRVHTLQRRLSHDDKEYLF
jgi:hypothetical protein